MRMQEMEIHDYARQLLDAHGDKAVAEAAQKASALEKQGNNEQAENWRLAIARVRKIVERWGIEFPAIPELDIEGVDVGDIDAEDIIPVF